MLIDRLKGIKKKDYFNRLSKEFRDLYDSFDSEKVEGFVTCNLHCGCKTFYPVSSKGKFLDGMRSYGPSCREEDKRHPREIKDIKVVWNPKIIIPDEEQKIVGFAIGNLHCGCKAICTFDLAGDFLEYTRLIGHYFEGGHPPKATSIDVIWNPLVPEREQTNILDTVFGYIYKDFPKKEE